MPTLIAAKLKPLHSPSPHSQLLPHPYPQLSLRRHSAVSEGAGKYPGPQPDKTKAKDTQMMPVERGRKLCASSGTAKPTPCPLTNRSLSLTS